MQSRGSLQLHHGLRNHTEDGGAFDMLKKNFVHLARLEKKDFVHPHESWCNLAAGRHITRKHSTVCQKPFWMRAIQWESTVLYPALRVQVRTRHAFARHFPTKSDFRHTPSRTRKVHSLTQHVSTGTSVHGAASPDQPYLNQHHQGV